LAAHFAFVGSANGISLTDLVAKSSDYSSLVA
jgi:hypothetical protein